MKDKIIACEGQKFFTVTGLPFTYKFHSHYIVPIRNGREINQHIQLTEIEKAIKLSPSTPGEISSVVRGSSYVFAIINDSRIK
jgi:phage-related protein